jgi:hypothetical protein
MSLKQYLILCVNREKPIHMCVACIRNNESALDLFPHGRAQRGGDLYAWIAYLAKVKWMAWQPTIEAIYYRDSVNMVTETAPYSIDLIHGMVRDFNPIVDESELQELKRFVNRKIWEAWLWHRLRNDSHFRIASNLYWQNDIVFCLVRSAAAVLPTIVLKQLLKLRILVRSLRPSVAPAR